MKAARKFPQVPQEARAFTWRLAWVVILLAGGAGAVLYRAVDLQYLNQEFLADRGDARVMRVQKILAHRGSIVDRFGELLAVSTPVDAVLVNPRELLEDYENIRLLAGALHREPEWLKRRLAGGADRQGLPLNILLEPGQSLRLKQLNIPGVFTERKYRRYYPAGEVTGHVLGFNNLDDHGQEGLELGYDEALGGEDGAKRVQRDNLGRNVKDIASIRAARPGAVLESSIDLRIQYLAYRALKAAVTEHHAVSGSVVVVDVDTGEILAMVNQPAFNPNDRSQFDVAHYRNRAALDLIEPGSVVKPFVVAAAFQAGTLSPQTVIDTNPGTLVFGRYTIRDHENYGRITPVQILAKSSNIGIIKIALAQRPEDIWSVYTGVGFGQGPASGFPGETAGLLPPLKDWRPLAVKSLAFGYGLSMTPMQLVSAYATLASGGIRRPLTFRRVSTSVPGERVINEAVAHSVVNILETVVSEDGTARRAAIEGYRVSGKTGTAQINISGGYDNNGYVATFAGMVPASKPRLAAVVVISAPQGAHHGGDVSAPVFAEIMSGAVRLMGIPPDNLAGIEPGALLQANAP